MLFVAVQHWPSFCQRVQESNMPFVDSLICNSQWVHWLVSELNLSGKKPY